jgi:hypothetical protein
MTPAGGVRWIRALAEIERDADGRALRMVGAHLDVTDQKLTDARLAEQAERCSRPIAARTSSWPSCRTNFAIRWPR